MLMELTSKGLREISPEGKNDLKPGTKLKLNGYNDPEFIVVKNLGISGNYGAKYLTINLEKLIFSYYEAYQLKFISEKQDNRIQTYIMDDEPLPADQVADLCKKAEKNEARIKAEKEAAAREMEEKRRKGKEIIDQIKPAWAKAVIVAYKEIDDCDRMTDYFATKSGPEYLLAWSKHTRDLFPEMRKAARNMPETEHLATAPPLREGERYPADEHREKYSMGAGYYLKAGSRYSTGWKVKKVPLGWGMDMLYYAAGDGRCRIPERKSTVRHPAEPEGKITQVDHITITENEEKNGVEIRFPEKPEKAVLDILKSHGFRWSRYSKCWYKKRTPEVLEFAKSLRG